MTMECCRHDGKAILQVPSRLKTNTREFVCSILSASSIFLAVIISSSLTVDTVSAQNADLSRSSLVLGDDRLEGDAYLLIRFQVVDPDDGSPVRAAEVVVGDYVDRRIASISTDQEGLAVIIFRESYDLTRYAPLTITVRTPMREQWQRVIEEGEILDNAELVAIWIPLSSQPYGPLTDKVIIDAVKQRHYSDYYSDGAPVTIDEHNYVRARHAGGYSVWSMGIGMRRLRRRPTRVDRPDWPGEPSRPTITTLSDGPVVFDVYPTDLAPSHWYAAVDACKHLSGHGYDDWELPSIEELAVLYDCRQAVPGLADAVYWSSTETSGSYVWVLSFRDSHDGGQRGLIDKGTTYNISEGTLRVRCIRNRK